MNRSLLGEFAGRLAGWEWDVALLQEAPPRWQAELARRTGAGSAIALTSRNWLSFARRAAARLNPDLIASNEGGSNQLLVRPPGRIAEVRRLTLTRRPERRWMLWSRLELQGGRRLAVASLHATAGRPAAAARELELAAEAATEWACGDPLILGGDLNLRPLPDAELFTLLRERFGLAPPTARYALDHLLARGLEVVEAPTQLAPEQREVPGPGGLPIRLSDHAPVVASFGMR